jgi:hypothetical protein
MGWVEEKFQYESDLKRFVPQLWDEMRDRIGVAVAEFNGHTSDASEKHLEVKDCTSMGPYCRRVSKRFGAASIEIFLHDKVRLLKASSLHATPTMESGEVRSGGKTIGGYRIKADRSGAEFFLEGGDQPSISVERACQLALEEFVFSP